MENGSKWAKGLRGQLACCILPLMSIDTDPWRHLTKLIFKYRNLRFCQTRKTSTDWSHGRLLSRSHVRLHDKSLAATQYVTFPMTWWNTWFQTFYEEIYGRKVLLYVFHYTDNLNIDMSFFTPPFFFYFIGQKYETAAITFTGLSWLVWELILLLIFCFNGCKREMRKKEKIPEEWYS